MSVIRNILNSTKALVSNSLPTTGSNTFIGTQTLSGSIIPAIDNTYDLGSTTYQWKDIYVSSGSLYIDGTKVLGSTGTELQITTDVGQSIKILEAGSDSIILQSSDGDIELKSSGGGDILLDPTTGVIALKGTMTIHSGNKVVSSDGNAIQFGDDLGITGSIITTGNVNGINLTTFSSSVVSTFNTIQSNTSSLTNRLNNVEITTASIQSQISRIQESTASLNLFTSSVESKNVTIASYTASMNTFTASNENTSLNAATSSYEIKGRGLVSGSSQIDVMSTTNIARLATTGSNTFFGTQTYSGSVYIANDLVVQGSSSIQYISASSVSIGTNIVQLNTANPSVRFAGLTIIDSGSIGGSGSFLYDSVQDEFIFIHRGNGVNITSSHFVLGPETYDNLGNETYLTNNRLSKGTGKEHLNDSNISDDGTLITLGSNTTITGTLLATGTTLVSSSTQVIGILSSLNTYTGSNDTTNTAQNSRLTSIESVTGSYETKGRGIVSGSSQITLASTTGFGTYINQAVLTTSSPTFVSVTGTITQSGTGDSNAPFRFGSDYSGWMTHVAGTPGSNNGWGLFWAGDSGAQYGTNQAGAAGNIWSNSTNPNEYVFVGNGTTVMSVHGNTGNVWIKGETRVASQLRVNGGTSTSPAAVFTSGGASWSEGIWINPSPNNYAGVYFLTAADTPGDGMWFTGKVSNTVSGWEHAYGIFRRGYTSPIGGGTATFAIKQDGTAYFNENVINTKANKALTFVQLNSTNFATKTFTFSGNTTGNFAVTDFSGIPSNAKAVQVYGWYHITGYGGGAGQGDHAVSWFGPATINNTTQWSGPGAGWPNSESSYTPRFHGTFMMEHDGDASGANMTNYMHYYGSWHTGTINVHTDGNIYYSLAAGYSGGTHYNALVATGYWI